MQLVLPWGTLELRWPFRVGLGFESPHQSLIVMGQPLGGARLPARLCFLAQVTLAGKWSHCELSASLNPWKLGDGHGPGERAKGPHTTSVTTSRSQLARCKRTAPFTLQQEMMLWPHDFNIFVAIVFLV